MDLIKSTLNDLAIKITGSNNEREDLYDVITIEKYIDKLVRRAVETPLRYISMWSFTEQGLDIVDENYGDGIYFKLSEPGSAILISGMKQDVQNALKFVEKYTDILSVETNLIDFKTIYIEVTYRDKLTEIENQTSVNIQI